jgi:hypothetical protein
MWHERKMPERWYELLRKRMQIEEQRMRVIRDGGIVDNAYQEDLLAQADSLDREMLLVMRQAIGSSPPRCLLAPMSAWVSLTARFPD